MTATLIVGVGTIGGALVDELLRMDPGILLYVADSKSCVKVEGDDWRRALQISKNQKQKQEEAFSHLIPSVSCIIDCTASDRIGSLYTQWINEAGVRRVITANKKGLLAADPSSFHKLWPLIQTGVLGIEATVGAGLPVIRTILQMQRAGDRIRQVRAILSGSLSYILSNYDFGNDNNSFSDVVRKAMQLKYTEPDPRQDLSGMDVMRKAVILARIAFDHHQAAAAVDQPYCGIIPKPNEEEISVEQFLASSLPDALMAEKRAGAHQRGKVLRHVVSISPESLKVGLEEYCDRYE